MMHDGMLPNLRAIAEEYQTDRQAAFQDCAARRYLTFMPRTSTVRKET